MFEASASFKAFLKFLRRLPEMKTINLIKINKARGQLKILNVVFSKLYFGSKQLNASNFVRKFLVLDNDSSVLVYPIQVFANAGEDSRVV